MTALLLKIIAVVSMIVDHAGAIFFPRCMIHIFGYTIYPLRVFGRLAFPIYCFLLIEGIRHTSNWKKYAIRLAILAFISEVPFDLALFGGITWKYQNVFFTLLLGLLAVQCDLELQKRNHYGEGIIAFLIAAFIAWKMHTDYGAFGIAFIMTFYYLRNNLLFLTLGIGAIGLYMGMSEPFCVAAIIPIACYNGKQGYKSKALQLTWYFIYPIHLILFAIIKRFII